VGWGREGVRESGRLTRCKPLLSRCEHLRHKESRLARAAPVGRLAWRQSRWMSRSSLWRSCTLSQLGQRCSWRCSRPLQTVNKKPTWFSCRGSFPPSWMCEARSRALDRGEDPTRSRTLPSPPPLSCHRRRAMGSPSNNRAWWAEGAAWRPGCTWRAACWQVASPSCPSPPSGALPLDQPGKTQLCREELQSYVPLRV